MDVNAGSILPGSMVWRDEMEWPSDGAFGFIWGCVWGADASDVASRSPLLDRLDFPERARIGDEGRIRG